MSVFLFSSDTHLRTRINHLSASPCRVIHRESQLLQWGAEELTPQDVAIIDERGCPVPMSQLLCWLVSRQPHLQLVILLHAAATLTVPRHVTAGTMTFLSKPFSDAALSDILPHSGQEVMEHAQYDHLASQLVGSSEPIRKLRSEIQRLDRRYTSVHIHGETGTGKEIVARLIHAQMRATGPFLAENCSLLDGSLLDNILFGHKRGAFTDAQEDHQGIIARAHRGTLFLDEIENLSPNTQAKLLRVLENHSFTPLGGADAIHSDFLFVSAGNVTLEHLVQEQRMRRDFYHRIAMKHLVIPPLRERLQDIPALCGCFLSRHGDTRKLTSGGFERLKAHPWPGNVRELFTVLHRSMIRCGSQPEIHVEEDDMLPMY